MWKKLKISAPGIEVRQADYNQPAHWDTALENVHFGDLFDL